ncbi:MobF family relaxase [Pseudomonas sp. PDM11]|uniref:MobF family relaxase n=1 Tax=Pseudomonas sp. PDM11 TaxID=2769309 RepID=UPI001782A815|nr:MobF family relaxase [Pseudomonas sp. PDM11]MBD9399129.1 relaxase domain-containing protein [Pseudomonas sp. PDM11]
MSIFTIDKFCSKDIPSRADYNEIGLELTYSRSGSEDYYFNSNSDTLLAALVGSGSHKLNLGSMPKPGDYQALMSGINPRTDEVFCSKTRQTQLQTDNHALAGFSTSFNVEKSLSLLYANLPRNQQMKFEQAMMEAASRTIQHLEEGGHFAYRTGAQGSETHPGEVVAATYLHFTNRNQEPHLHVHAEIPNLILGIDGQWRTLDARELYRRQVEIGALFDASLASILQRDLPEIASHLECNPERSGLVVVGIDHHTVMRFSTRRQEIQDGLQAMGASGADAARAVAKRTRQAKASVDAKTLREEWKSCLADLTFSTGDLTPPTMLAVEALVFKNNSVFKQHDLDRAVAMLSILHGGIGSLSEIKSAVARQLGVIRLPHTSGEETYFTTETFRQLEVDLLRFARKASKRSQHFTLTDLQIQQALRQCEQEKGFPLRDEQVQAMVHATDGRLIAIIQGAAGTGKSASLGALNIAYGSAGHRVLGLAPSGAAAAELQKSSGIDSQTIHALLMRLENDNARKPFHLTDRDVIVLDEAGMVDTRTLHKLLSHVEAAGAKIVLVGDSKQLEAVGSASTLHMLTQHLGAARLEQIARQRSADDRAISQAWFSAAGDAPAMMQQRGLLRETSNEQTSPIELILTDATKVHRAGTDWREILLLADRNSHVNQLNQRVREIRLMHGELDNKVEKVVQVSNDRGYSRELALCPGDRIMLRKNSKLDQTPVFNGDRATVICIEDRKTDTDGAKKETVVHARLDRTDAEITWCLSDYDKLDHAYAMTVHKSQGLTVEHAFYLTSETTDRRSAYVAFTRSKAACPFYLAPECESTFANRTSLFKAKVTALDADPATKQRTLHTSIGAVETAIRTQQPGTKELLEKAGIRFSYLGASNNPDAQVRTHIQDWSPQPSTRQKLLLLIQRLRARLNRINAPTKTLGQRRTPSAPHQLDSVQL